MFGIGEDFKQPEQWVDVISISRILGRKTVKASQADFKELGQKIGPRGGFLGTGGRGNRLQDGLLEADALLVAPNLKQTKTSTLQIIFCKSARNLKTHQSLVVLVDVKDEKKPPQLVPQ